MEDEGGAWQGGGRQGAGRQGGGRQGGGRQGGGRQGGGRQGGEEGPLDVKKWTAPDVKKWVIEKGFGAFQEKFNYTTGDILLKLKFDDIRQLEIPVEAAMPLSKAIESLMPLTPTTVQGEQTRNKLIVILQTFLQSNDNNMGSLLKLTLNTSDLVLDEIQDSWMVDPGLLQSIIEIADDHIKHCTSANRLFLCGTPSYGEMDVMFDIHTAGRVTKFTVPPFSALEIYSLLSRILQNEVLNFDIYFTLWCCFGGIPGLYQLAKSNNSYSHNHVELDKIFTILKGFYPLSVEEKNFISSIPQQGLLMKLNTNDPVVTRLMALEVIEQVSGNLLFVKDNILSNWNILYNSTLNNKDRIQNMKGPGLENLVASILNPLLAFCNIPEADNFRLTGGGYGPRDIDVLAKHIQYDVYVAISCKVDPAGHESNFLANINTHIKPTNAIIYLLLCSPCAIPTYVFRRFPKNIRISQIIPVDLSIVIPQSSSQTHFSYTLVGDWPILIRSKLCETLRDHQRGVHHLIGYRRVGKTTLLEQSIKNALYISCKSFTLVKVFQQPIQQPI